MGSRHNCYVLTKGQTSNVAPSAADSSEEPTSKLRCPHPCSVQTGSANSRLMEAFATGAETPAMGWNAAPSDTVRSPCPLPSPPHWPFPASWYSSCGRHGEKLQLFLCDINSSLKVSLGLARPCELTWIRRAQYYYARPVNLVSLVPPALSRSRPDVNRIAERPSQNNKIQ